MEEPGGITLFEVPDELTYFVGNECYIVLNPAFGGRCRLDPFEFGVLQQLAADPESASFHQSKAIDIALSKLIVNWIVYFKGNRPKLEIKESKLSQVYYAITDGCNLRCPYCYASSEKRLAGELSNKESLDLVSQVADFGADTIIFTGGEPMLRKDLFEVVEHANQLGLKSNVITNATLIKTPDIAKKFARLFNMVTISLDGGTAETHDPTRGKGTFATTHRAIQLLNAEGVVPNINHIVTSSNVEQLEDFAVFAEDLNISNIRLMSHNKLGRGTDDDECFEWEDHLKVQQIAWTSPVATKLRPDGPKALTNCSVRGNCGMGGNEIYVNSLGNVYPCKLVTENSHFAGNIRFQPLAEIFAGRLLRSMRDSTVFGGDYHTDCSKCYIKTACGGGCRATHMSETLDLKKNSRAQCRILRHGISSQFWLEQGVQRSELAKNDRQMTVPRLLKNDQIHPVYDDWKTSIA